jgi:hypothetical protein
MKENSGPAPEKKQPDREASGGTSPPTRPESVGKPSDHRTPTVEAPAKHLPRPTRR